VKLTKRQIKDNIYMSQNAACTKITFELEIHIKFKILLIIPR